jgi:NodT family efflux transporter outer membrane factor (OMF) lipoprotein
MAQYLAIAYHEYRGVVHRHQILSSDIGLIMQRLASGIMLCTLLTACAVGPDFLSPKPPATNEYTATPLQEQTDAANGIGGEAQSFVKDKDISADWWTLFHSEALDKTIRAALTDATAVAKLRQTQENVKAETGASLLPKIDAKASATREKFSSAAFGLSGAGTGSPVPSGSIFNLYNASVNVSYALDFFGGARREIEALGAEAEYQHFELEAAQLSLSSNLATVAFKEASLRAQIKATRQMIHDEDELLAIVEKQLALGGAAEKDVMAQRTQAEQTKAMLPPLEKELEAARHQLAVYMGKLPSEASLPEFQLESFTLPQELPVSLPSGLVRQRPDIRAAEARLHEASAQIGVATANLLPQINLSASYGPETTHIKDLFKADSMIWSLGSSLAQPIFHGGELLAKRRASMAAYDEAAANYQQTVLQAFQNVADSLKALEFDASTLKAQANATEQAKNTFDITSKQFKLGGVSHLTLLNAQRAYQQTRLALAQAQAARFADTAALFQALGGGWWNRNAQAEKAPE